MRFHDPSVTVTAGAERPFANTYWVEPGRLLAGEYPGAANRDDAATRLQRLLALGIDTFIDLTEAGELPDYAAHLAELTPRAIHRRFPVLDHDVPPSIEFMSAALDCIESLLAEGRRIYVHCRAGVGRTGTVIGCWFIRCGFGNEDALDRLAELWQQSERSRFIPNVPETAAQERYVRFWRETNAARAQVNDGGRLAGALYGLALGEAAASQRPGQWGGNTAMTLLLAESLLDRSGHEPEDQMRRYFEWQRTGCPPGASRMIEVPSAVRRAVATWQWTRKPYAGSHDPASLDAHSLPRTVAVALFYADQPAPLLEVAADASRTTQQSPLVLDACRLYAALVVAALAGVEKNALLQFSGHPAFDLLRERQLKPEVAALLRHAGAAQLPAAREGATGVVTAVMKAFASTDDFSSGLALLGRMPGDVAAAACYGALLGAHRPSALPGNLLAGVADRAALDDVARRLAAFRMRRPV